MTTGSQDALSALTEKEEQTLRLMVRGHDAKSIARSLDLSVHTINERLRDARRKMAVSSSREAARILLEAEGDAVAPFPQSHAYQEIGGDARPDPTEEGDAPVHGAGQARRRPFILIGAFAMTFLLGLLALAASPQTPSEAPIVSGSGPTVTDAKVVAAARDFLVMVVQGRWDESYRATGASFRSLNTLEVWTRASEQARGPLGAILLRSFVSQQNLPAPPAGYEVVEFRTRFANREVVETVSLDREGGVWRIVGIMID